jgi:uncharacterized protein YggE
MRKKIILLSSILVISILLVACGSVSTQPGITSALAQTDDNDSPKSTLSVSGSGVVTLSPDIAYVTIGVHTEGSDASDVVAENNQDTQAVIDSLESLDINPQDIQTTNFSIFPQQQFDENGRPTGEITYMVDNSVFVTVRELDNIGEVLNAAVEAGANSISGIQFDVEDRTDAIAEAQAAAVQNAQSQAENLAQAAGIELGQIISINTFGGAVPLPKFDGVGGGAAVAESSQVPVSTGQMRISIEVNMVFEITQ